MIISDEQAHLAAEYLQSNLTTSGRASADQGRGVAPEFLKRVRDELRDVPETRGDRVEEARAHLLEELPGDQVAAKMIGRIISDSIR